MRITHILFCLLLFSLLSCKNTSEEYTANPWEAARAYYKEHLNNTIAGLEKLQKNTVDDPENKEIFLNLRREFKLAEPYVSYLNPEVGHRANGPALPVFREDNGKVLKPIGLQKLEETLYDGGVDNETFHNEVKMTLGFMHVLQKNIADRELTPQRFFVATQQQLMRIVSFSMANFDTPVSAQGVKDAALSLNGLREVYEIILQDSIQNIDKDIDEQFIQSVHAGVAFAEAYTGENKDFDRFTYIRDYVNPVCRAWKQVRDASGMWKDSKDFPFNFDAPTFFEQDSFNLTYFTPSVNQNPTEEQIALGKKLFFDPNLSAAGTMACASCHSPEKAYQDGEVTSLDNSGKAMDRNAPTLVNVAYQQNFFWDARSEDLLSQINSVFTNDREFASEVHQFSDEILQDSTYIKLFKNAYGGIPKQNRDLVRAISSYISTLKGFDSKFDKNIRGDEDTFTAQEKRGFNLFMGEALCATCHFIPLTNGTVPPFFSESEKEVIGVPETAENTALDSDAGFYVVYREDKHKGMFKTPTVRNAALTAPYMHNGIYATLEEVMDFYNKGGGGGLGFDLPHQTLPFDNLDLSQEDLDALVAFVKTLNDVPQADNY